MKIPKPFCFSLKKENVLSVEHFYKVNGFRKNLQFLFVCKNQMPDGRKTKQDSFIRIVFIRIHLLIIRIVVYVNGIYFIFPPNKSVHNIKKLFISILIQQFKQTLILTHT